GLLAAAISMMGSTSDPQMLRAIDTSNETQAIDILARGMSQRSRSFWERTLARIHAYDGNAAAKVPAGQLLMHGTSPVGVVLTPASVRSDGDGPARRMINLSSWYIDPAHRWRGPMMLRAILRDHDATFTDLTPTPAVQKILLALGFRSINSG